LGVAGAAAVACGVLSFSYSFAWRSDAELWRRAVDAQPDAYYAWMKLGETERDRLRFAEADAAYDRAIALEPELLPARGGRMLSCLARTDHDAGRRQALPLDLAADYTSAYGNARAMLDAAARIFARGYEDCAFRVLLESTHVRPPLADDLIFAVANDWLRVGRPDRARTLLERVSPAGRSSDDWRRLFEAATGSGTVR
jgi:tetratricopeptide (TPR) repeat protein